jgi:hypothetical protein
MASSSTITPTTLWQLRGRANLLTECTLQRVATGEFEIRILRTGAILFGERYGSEEEARRHAGDYYESLIGKGWRSAA